MNPAVISRAILARLQADSTLYSGGAWTAALVGGGAWPKQNPNTSPAYPNLVWGIDWEADNTLQGMLGAATVTFVCYDIERDGTPNLEVLIDRLIGDAMLSSGSRGAPTYGFHNHKLALPSLGSTNVQGAVAGDMNLESTAIGPSDTENVIQAMLRFKVYIQNVAANQ